MIHKDLPTPTETAFRSHPRCVVSVTYVRTHCFHGGNTGSNPVGDANFINHLQIPSRIFVGPLQSDKPRCLFFHRSCRAASSPHTIAMTETDLVPKRSCHRETVPCFARLHRGDAIGALALSEKFARGRAESQPKRFEILGHDLP
jgi:hypothetical protein